MSASTSTFPYNTTTTKTARTIIIPFTETNHYSIGTEPCLSVTTIFNGTQLSFFTTEGYPAPKQPHPKPKRINKLLRKIGR